MLCLVHSSGVILIGWIHDGLRRLLLLVIRTYQYCISPLFPPCCRFYPSCSQYALEAIERHGVWRGGWLSLKRLLRCRPGFDYGWDPVPNVPNESGE